MTATMYSRRLFKLRLSRQLKQSRESMTASALYSDVLIEPSTLPVVKPSEPKPFSDLPGPKSYPFLGGIHNYFPGGKMELSLLKLNTSMTTINITKM